MSPWFPLLVFVAVLNLLLFIIVRDRWGRVVWFLLLAAIVGAIGGDLVAGRTGLEALQLGDVHLIGASVGAQLAMVAVLLLGALGPTREVDAAPRRKGRSAPQRRPRTRAPAEAEESEVPRIAGRGARSR
jgi:hypothetical protein